MRQPVPRSTHLPTVLLTLSVALVQVAGCATMKLPALLKEKHAKADAANPVAQIVCVWQPAEGRGLDDSPARGFAGQIVFLTAKSPTPVEVEGNVTIYLFDDHGTPEERSRPLHTFRFDAGSWQTYLVPTGWGPTYQLFIPYVRKGTQRASCSLAVQIETPEGRRVTSDMANIVLRGSESHGGAAAARYLPQHSRLPAGRLKVVGPGGMSSVVSGSAPLPSSALPAGTDASGYEAPKFESFSIPYDFRSANAQ